MLESIQVKGFRCLRDLTIEVPSGGLIVMIGPNGAGKTAVLEAMSFLGSAVRDGLRNTLQRHGGLDSLVWKGKGSPGTVEFTVRFRPAEGSPFEADGGPVEYRLVLGRQRGGLPQVLHESVVVYKRGLGSRPFTAMHRHGDDRWLANVRSRERDGLDDAAEPAAEDRNSFSPAPDALLLSFAQDAERYPTPMHVHEALAGIVVYGGFRNDAGWVTGVEDADVRPSAVTERVVRIDPRATRLLNALHTLSSHAPRAWEELVRDFRAIFPWCGDVRFPPAPAGRGQIMLTWMDERTGNQMYLDEMSQGMLTYLALLAALHSPEPAALLGFDEPERHLHPELMRRLVAIMETKATRTPILIATHSDRLLDFLEAPAESIRIVEFTDDRGTRLESLDREALQAWLEDFRVSDLRARGQLDRLEDSDD